MIKDNNKLINNVSRSFTKNEEWPVNDKGSWIETTKGRRESWTKEDLDGRNNYKWDTKRDLEQNTIPVY